VEIDLDRHRFLTGADLKHLLVSCGSDLRALELDVAVGDLRTDVFAFTPRLESLRIDGLAFCRSATSLAASSKGAVNAEALADALSGIGLT